MLSLNFDDVAFTLIYTNGKWREFDDDYPGLEENQKQFKSNGKISIKPQLDRILLTHPEPYYYTSLYKHLLSKENRYYLSRVVPINNYY